MTATTSSVDISEIGLTVLAEGGSNPVVDIVFIHGLQGHPYKTWTYHGNVAEKSTRSEKKFSLKRLLGGKAKSPNRTEQTTITVYWPRDVLPQDIKNARVMTYGYDSHVSHFFQGPANQNGIIPHGRSLLSALESQRRDNPTRPIFFVVHSLGGLVLKEVCEPIVPDLVLILPHFVTASLYGCIALGTL